MRICKECVSELELNKENFPSRENGLFRYVCRTCDNKARNSRQAEKLKDKRKVRQDKLDKELELFNNGYKVCSSCEQECVISQFNKHKQGRFGLDPTCKNCKQKAKDNKFGKTEPLRKCRECGTEAWKSIDLDLFVKAGGRNKFGRYNICKRCYSVDDNTIKHNNSLKRRCSKFNITVEQYHQMVKEQSNSCAICKKHKDDFAGRGNSFHIDHCHDTGKVRGLLCSNCNTGLGHFKDDIIALEKAIEYIKNV